MWPDTGSVLWRQLQPPIRLPARPLPAARRVMSALYTFDPRDAVVTRCVDTWCFTEIRKQESVVNLYVHDATSKWLVLAFYWTAYQFTVVSIFSERELMFTFAICYRPSVCRL